MKITKRSAFITLGAIAAVTTPVVAVVACGSNNDNNTVTSTSKKSDITKELVSKMDIPTFIEYLKNNNLVTYDKTNDIISFNKTTTFEDGVSFPDNYVRSFDFTNLPQEQKDHIILRGKITTNGQTRLAGLNLDQIDTFPTALEVDGNNPTYHGTTWSNKAIIDGKPLKFDFDDGMTATPSKAYTEENGAKTYYKYDGTNWTSASESDSSWQKWFGKLIKEHNYDSLTDPDLKRAGQIKIICGLQNDETITRP